MLRKIYKISYYINQICFSAASGFLGAMLLLVLFQVLARYLFQVVPIWTEEAARYCMVWGGLLGSTVSFYKDWDPRLFKPPPSGTGAWSVAATWIRAVSVVVFLGPILYHSGRFILRTFFRTSEGLGIPMAFITIAVPMALAIILIHLIAKLLSNFLSDQLEEIKK